MEPHYLSVIGTRLLHAYQGINQERLKSQLKTPVLSIQPAMASWGRYDPTTRTISLRMGLIMEHPWPAVIEVLKHEMAHQVVHELFGLDHAPPHGEAWRRACKMLGIDPIVSGDPIVLADEQDIPTPLRRARKLLALAEKNSNVHEAAAALAAVQRIMDEYQLSMDALRDDDPHRMMSVAWFGDVCKRRPRYLSLLAIILSDHFHVRCIWVPSLDLLRGGIEGQQLEVCGTKTHLTIAHHVYDSVINQLKLLWDAHSGRGARQKNAFYDGVLMGFSSTLQNEQKKSRMEGLVHLNDPKLNAFYKQRHPHTRSVSVGVNSRDRAYSDGHEAGRSLRIGKGVGGEKSTRMLAS